MSITISLVVFVIGVTTGESALFAVALNFDTSFLCVYVFFVFDLLFAPLFVA